MSDAFAANRRTVEYHKDIGQFQTRYNMQPIALRTIFFLLLGITTLNKGSAQGQTAGADNTYCVATKGAQYETTNFAPRWRTRPNARPWSKGCARMEPAIFAALMML